MIRIALLFTTACSVASALPMSPSHGFAMVLPMSANQDIVSALPMSDRDTVASRQPFRVSRIEPPPIEVTPTGYANIPVMRSQAFQHMRSLSIPVRSEDHSVESEAKLHFAEVLKEIEHLPMEEEALISGEVDSEERITHPRSVAGTATKRSGTATKRSGTATKRSGTSTKRSATATKRLATSTKRSGTAAKRSATATKRSGAATKRSATATKRSGTATKRSGTATKRSGTATKRLEAVRGNPPKASQPKEVSEEETSEAVSEEKEGAADLKQNGGEEHHEAICEVVIEIIKEVPFMKVVPVAAHAHGGHIDKEVDEVIVGEMIVPIAEVIGVGPCKKLVEQLKKHQHESQEPIERLFYSIPEQK